MLKLLRAGAPAGVLALACIAGYALPGVFAPLRGGIVPALGLVMFGMGLTLSVAQVRSLLARPWLLALGTALQFMVMPAAGWLSAWLFRLPPELAAGLILTGSAPGGTASNVMVYLARGDLALSVGCTSLSTLLAPLFTPLFTELYAGTQVAVPALAMARDTALIVLGPVLAGMAVRAWWPGGAQRIGRVLPFLALTVVGLIVAIILALNHDRLGQVGAALAGAVVLHNAMGLGLGYGAAAACRLGEPQRRAIALEVGMQNSGLASALALKFLPPLAALPAALFSVWHNVSALALAAWWARHDGGHAPPAGG